MDTAYLIDESFVICNDEEIMSKKKFFATVLFFCRITLKQSEILQYLLAIFLCAFI